MHGLFDSRRLNREAIGLSIKHYNEGEYKMAVATDDLIIFEDKSDGYIQKKALISDLPGGGSGMSDLVDDLTPDLGGDLGANGHQINMNDNVISRPLLEDYAEKLEIDTSSTTTKDLDLETANNFEITLDNNCTFTFLNPPASGKAGSFTLILKQDGTGSRTTTWPASVDWAGGTAPTLSTGATDVDILTFMTNRWRNNLVWILRGR
ncbi:MAG TPA: hypothetical protein QF468_06555 [Nitrospinota bacterium]|jgi:hypothetical protein|nr:hypothetical protein [Nitrospinota bacterium]